MPTDIKLPGGPKRFATAVFLAFFALFHPSGSAAAEGFYLGGAVGWEYADADYAKSITLNLPDAASVTNRDGDSDKGGIGSFRAVLGHRWNLPGGAYLSGEVDAALRLDNSVSGSIEGTTTPGNPDSDVFPGDWSLEKNHSVGFSVKLGYSPGASVFLGEGGSVYAVAGVQRLDVTFETTATGTLSDGTVLDNARFSKDRSATPWLFGGGVEIGGEKNRLDLRVTYSAYDVSYRSGDGTTIGTPIVGYEFDVSEWGFRLGYTRSLGFGLGI